MAKMVHDAPHAMFVNLVRGGAIPLAYHGREPAFQELLYGEAFRDKGDAVVVLLLVHAELFCRLFTCLRIEALDLALPIHVPEIDPCDPAPIAALHNTPFTVAASFCHS